MMIGRSVIPLAISVGMLAWPTVILAQEVQTAAAASGKRPAPPSTSAGLAGLAKVPGARQSQTADFRGAIASNDARRIADWIVTASDNNGLPFVIIDKVRAKVFVFDAAGQLRGASSALLGRARGDDTVAGIGSLRLSAIRPEERITPAGRFLATLGRDLHQDILWIDYASSLSLHRVITGNPGDHRLQRLATTSLSDKRISYGCINVPVRFYEDVVLGAFTGARGVVYILPEIKMIEDVFPSLAPPRYDGGARTPRTPSPALSDQIHDAVTGVD